MLRRLDFCIVCIVALLLRALSKLCAAQVVGATGVAGVCELIGQVRKAGDKARCPE
jgi:hypothetical protein